MNLPFDRWLPAQRWYSGRGREIATARPATVVALDTDLDLAVLRVEYTDGATETYQVLVRWGTGAESACIGSDGTRTGYDAMVDPQAAGRLLSLLDASDQIDTVRFRREPGADLGPGTPVRVMGAEQSNTSVVFGEQSILKVFRRLIPGINPDVELTRALAGNPYITPLLGSYEIDWDTEQYMLGMVSTFARDSTDGWQLVTAASGEDFTEESHRLGQAVASVHRDLADRLGTRVKPFPVQTMIERLRAVAVQVPALRDRVAEIEQRYRQLADEPSTEQRIHGDLHLGQVLHTPTGWLVIDFEGEPGQPLQERRRPDSPLRDVAGMLRSYDYAAHQRQTAGQDQDAAREWARRNSAAFCEGYIAGSAIDPRQAAGVLRAYELDKAVYEAGYEARYRPSWLPIPLGAIERLLAV
ncbi:phosphotransferase [Mycobacterium sp. AMU20-3851]|uniref:maltokinase N-terminal cap-like domain-containing protein n=1 Tax=Mycobacterium sp. AMU20-3851 TaxID=3122055 RepID=UPI003754B26C